MRDPITGADGGRVIPRTGGHEAGCAWPDDGHIQGGTRGLVFTGAESRRTAFVEFFPAAGGFLRGEGATVAEAEQACWASYQRLLRCPANADGTHSFVPGFGGFVRHRL